MSLKISDYRDAQVTRKTQIKPYFQIKIIHQYANKKEIQKT